MSDNVSSSCVELLSVFEHTVDSENVLFGIDSNGNIVELKNIELLSNDVDFNSSVIISADVSNRNSTDTFSLVNIEQERQQSETNDTSELNKVTAKKRKRNVQLWKQNLNKAKRNHGLEYVSKSGKTVSAKTFKSLNYCCKRNCIETVSEEECTNWHEKCWQ